MTRIRFSSAFTWLIPLALIALGPRVLAQEHVQKKFTVADGLPASFTYRAYADREGYLWIATTAGLSRFDGKQFVNYGLSDGLLSLKSDGLLEDSKGRMWVGTNAGMAEFRNNRFVYYPVSDSATIFGVADFTELRDGRILAETSAGLYEFAGTCWKPLKLASGFDPPHLRCRDVIEAGDGLYAKYDSVIVYRDPAGRWWRLPLPAGNGSISNRLSLAGGTAMASIDNHLYRLSGSQCIAIDTVNNPDKNYFSFAVDTRGSLWAGGADFLKTSLAGSWGRFSDSVSSARNIYFLSADSNAQVWAATSEGLIRIKNISAETIGHERGTPTLVNSIVPLPGGRLLIWSGGKDEFYYYEKGKFRPAALSLGKGNILLMASDHRDGAWVALTSGGFLHLEGSACKKIAAFSFPHRMSEVFDMQSSASRGGIWVCSDSTLLLGDSTGMRSFIPHNTGKPLEKPIRVWEARNGLVLVYLDGQGVFAITPAGDQVSLILQTGFDGHHKGRNQHDVFFYEDRSGEFWITYPGLGLFEYGFGKDHIPYRKRQYTAVTDGLQSDKIISLAADSADRLWIESDAGIDILEKGADDSRILFNYLSENDLGVSLNGFGRLVSMPEENEVWFFTPATIIHFHPGNIQLTKAAPRASIESITLNFKETDWHARGDSVHGYFDIPVNPELPYQNTLSIFFGAPDLGSLSADPQWAYRLLPLDTSWSPPSRLRSVSFARIPAGNYVFEVRSRDKASGWGASAILRFSVIPPFWGTLFFKVFTACLVCALTWLLIRTREKRIHQRAYIAGQLKDMEMKALKAQIKPHFIYNALNSIQALVVSGKKEESLRYIGSFSRLLRQVLEYTENNTISLDKELETLQLYVQVETLRLGMELHFRENFSEDLVSEFEKVPPLILQPFVENAIWHGLSRKEGFKEIVMSATVNGDWLVCEVRDNGIGRLAAMEWKVNSMPIHLSRALEITRKRLIDFNVDGGVDPIVFIDHLDSANKPTGTSVILSISRKPPRGF
ncbi:MAG TPA: histidine kinase [Puia sp.]|nr:histidine kinase [Puia sp.]